MFDYPSSHYKLLTMRKMTIIPKLPRYNKKLDNAYFLKACIKIRVLSDNMHILEVRVSAKEPSATLHFGKH